MSGKEKKSPSFPAVGNVAKVVSRGIAKVPSFRPRSTRQGIDSAEKSSDQKRQGSGTMPESVGGSSGFLKAPPTASDEAPLYTLVNRLATCDSFSGHEKDLVVQLGSAYSLCHKIQAKRSIRPNYDGVIEGNLLDFLQPLKAKFRVSGLMEAICDMAPLLKWTADANDGGKELSKDALWPKLHRLLGEIGQGFINEDLSDKSRELATYLAEAASPLIQSKIATFRKAYSPLFPPPKPDVLIRFQEYLGFIVSLVAVPWHCLAQQLAEILSLHVREACEDDALRFCSRRPPPPKLDDIRNGSLAAALKIPLPRPQSMIGSAKDPESEEATIDALLKRLPPEFGESGEARDRAQSRRLAWIGERANALADALEAILEAFKASLPYADTFFTRFGLHYSALILPVMRMKLMTSLFREVPALNEVQASAVRNGDRETLLATSKTGIRLFFHFRGILQEIGKLKGLRPEAIEGLEEAELEQAFAESPKYWGLTWEASLTHRIQRSVEKDASFEVAAAQVNITESSKDAMDLFVGLINSDFGPLNFVHSELDAKLLDAAIKALTTGVKVYADSMKAGALASQSQLKPPTIFRIANGIDRVGDFVRFECLPLLDKAHKGELFKSGGPSKENLAALETAHAVANDAAKAVLALYMDCVKSQIKLLVGLCFPEEAIRKENIDKAKRNPRDIISFVQGRIGDLRKDLLESMFPVGLQYLASILFTEAWEQVGRGQSQDFYSDIEEKTRGLWSFFSHEQLQPDPIADKQGRPVMQEPTFLEEVEPLKRLLDYLDCQKMDSERLILRYVSSICGKAGEIPADCKPCILYLELAAFEEKDPNFREIHVKLLQAKDFPALDHDGTSDCYVRLDLWPPSAFPPKAFPYKKSKAIRNTTHPEWNQLLILKHVDAAAFAVEEGLALQILLADSDHLSKDDLGGRLLLPLALVPLQKRCKGEEEQHLVRMSLLVPPLSFARDRDLQEKSFVVLEERVKAAGKEKEKEIPAKLFVKAERDILVDANAPVYIHVLRQSRFSLPVINQP